MLLKDAGLTGNLIIPDKVETIGNWAFNGCIGFTGYLTIGTDVKELGYFAFTDYMTSDNFPRDILRFSKVFCKALTCPLLRVYEIKNHYFATAFGRYSDYYSGETRYPRYLGVSIGLKAKYSTNPQWKYFTLIEEIEF